MCAVQYACVSVCVRFSMLQFSMCAVQCVHGSVCVRFSKRQCVTIAVTK